jgi:hypothetical protein
MFPFLSYLKHNPDSQKLWPKDDKYKKSTKDFTD